MSAIVDVHARQILDSRGNPTVEVDLRWKAARSAGPRFHPAPPPVRTKRWSCATATKAVTCGKGVLKAVEAVNGEIAGR